MRKVRAEWAMLLIADGEIWLRDNVVHAFPGSRFLQQFSSAYSSDLISIAFCRRWEDHNRAGGSRSDCISDQLDVSCMGIGTLLYNQPLEFVTILAGIFLYVFGGRINLPSPICQLKPVFLIYEAADAF